MTGNDEQKFRTAYSFHQRGDIGQAAKLYRELINANPNAFHALHLLGIIEASSGNFDKAKPLMARSLGIYPPNIEFFENYAALLSQLPDYPAALEICDQGLKLRSNSVALLYVRAGCLLKLERLAESIEQFDKLLRLQPKHAPALNDKAVALAQMKNYELALAAVREALSVEPRYADAHLNLAKVYSTLKHYDEALSAFDTALALDPRLANAWFGRGRTFQELNRPQEALADYDKGFALAPDHVEALDWKGGALLELGRFAEAVATIEKAIDLAPKEKKASAYLTLASAKRFSPDDPRLVSMAALADEMGSLPIDEQICLQFALGKAFADVDEHERSFRFFLKGNALKRSRLSYDEAGVLDLLKRTQAAFTADLIRARQGRGDPSAFPVFILGMPRSGSTLVEQILASHRQVFGAGEIIDLYRCIDEAGGAVAESRRTPEAISRISDEEFARLGASYVDRIRRATPPEATRISNKTTENFRLAGLIHLALPNARIIHTRRDPIDTCLSCFSQLFEDSLPYAFDLGELGRYYRAYEALMAHWRVVLPTNVMLEVQYEEVVGDLETQARRIVAHCGLEWDPHCLDFNRTARPVRTSSVRQVRQPIYKSSMGRWQTYEKFLRPLLAEMERPVPGEAGDRA